ncbi:SCO2521 family protein [Streptomyces thermospinosisporus]|uniref:SCO2521 family protein n=1 Tax=Streptomyces thermospinosisporus TaxID=161482 RepID=A0ABN1Z490_9ACTN
MTTAPGQPARSVLVCGEVRTCLLPSLHALDGRAAAQLLRLRADEHVRVCERPGRYALSPEVLTGVDCRLPTSNGAKVRAVGTVAARAALTEGRLLQSTAYVRLPATGPVVRRPWGQYLVRPGLVEPFGKLPLPAAAEGALRGAERGELDLGMIAEGLLAHLRRHPLLDRRVPFKSRPLRLRWIAGRVPEGERATLVNFTVAEGGLRTMQLRLPEDVPAASAAGLCEDLARHDWLLTTVQQMLDSRRLGAADGPAVLETLHPLVVHLLHLWMPRAHADPALAHLWDALEARPGFSRQWENLSRRIRDRLALQAVTTPHQTLSTR